MLTFAHSPAGMPIAIDAVAHLKRVGLAVPDCYCPACRTRLDPVLGQVRAHHFRHRPNARPCYAAGGEGELHLSAKLALLAALESLAREGRALRLQRACEACGQPAPEAHLPLSPAFRATAEEWLDPRKTLKPDVTLWEGERRAALFEVVASHPCGAEKWAALEAHAVPVYELRAEAVVGADGAGPWTPSDALAVERAIAWPGPQTCLACEARARSEKRREQEQAERIEAARRMRFYHPSSVCFVDHFLPDGSFRRAQLYACGVNFGERHFASLIDAQERVLCDVPEGFLGRPPEALRAAAAAWAREGGPYARIDSHGGFQELFFIDNRVHTLTQARALRPPPLRHWWQPVARHWEAGVALPAVPFLFPPRSRKRVAELLLEGAVPTWEATEGAGGRRVRVADWAIVVALWRQWARGEPLAPSKARAEAARREGLAGVFLYWHVPRRKLPPQ